MSDISEEPYPETSFAQLAAVEEGHWWFSARNQILIWTMKKHVPPFRNFLEIGCGTGFVLKGMSEAFPKVDFFGAEYFEEGLKFARERIPVAEFKQLDVTEMQETGDYDVIGLFDVLEHIDEDERALSRIHQALTAEGTIVLTVPQHMWLWSAADDHAYHRRRYSRDELLKKLETAGFNITFVSSFISLLLPLMYLARKKPAAKDFDPMAEFRISRLLNTALYTVMKLEIALLRIGLRFPAGGSLLVVAQK